jgi:hypothetical protein
MLKLFSPFYMYLWTLLELILCKTWDKIHKKALKLWITKIFWSILWTRSSVAYYRWLTTLLLVMNVFPPPIFEHSALLSYSSFTHPILVSNCRAQFTWIFCSTQDFSMNKSDNITNFAAGRIISCSMHHNSLCRDKNNPHISNGCKAMNHFFLFFISYVEAQYTLHLKMVVKTVIHCCLLYVGFLLGIFFDSEDGRAMFFWNAGLL